MAVFETEAPKYGRYLSDSLGYQEEGTIKSLKRCKYLTQASRLKRSCDNPKSSKNYLICIFILKV
jgi:hypothetical protein